MQQVYICTSLYSYFTKTLNIFDLYGHPEAKISFKQFLIVPAHPKLNWHENVDDENF